MAKFCTKCGKELADNEKFCPNCGQKSEINDGQNTKTAPAQRPKKKHGCLIAILTVIIFFGFVSVGFMMLVGQNSAIQKSVSGVSDSDEYMTMDEYNQIESGMSYEDVQTIVGSSGVVSSQTEMAGINISIITWYGNGTAGSNANVTFKNNEVTGKAQVGLK